MSSLARLEDLPRLPDETIEASNGEYVTVSHSKIPLHAQSSNIEYEVWFQTKRLDQSAIDRMKSIQLTTEAHGQETCDDPSAGRWTWFEVAIMENDKSKTPRKENDIELTWKSHENDFGTATKCKPGRRFGKEHDIFGLLKEGNVIAVRLCARFKGWSLYAESGYLVVELGNPDKKTPVQLSQTISQVKAAQQALYEINKTFYPNVEHKHLPSVPDTVYHAGVVTESKGSERPLRVLALDGGGVRGLETLVILDEIMKKAFPGRDVKPCHVFDMIGGTSTGGLIAIMLGRLEMSVEDCINKYEELMSKIFPPHFVDSTASNMGKLGNFLGVPGFVKSGISWVSSPFVKAAGAVETTARITWTGGKWGAGDLETVIKKLIEDELQGRGEGAESTLLIPKILKNQASGCKVFVTAVNMKEGNNKPPVLLRSYENPREKTALPNIKIWQAARATSAAPAYFKPLQVDGYQFVDGGLQANNPLGWLWNEVLTTFGAERTTACFLSLGTGVPPSQELPSAQADLSDPSKPVRMVEGLVGIATNTEIVNVLFRSLINALAPAAGVNKYWRFSMGDGSEVNGVNKFRITSAMDDPTTKARIRSLAADYICTPEVSDRVQYCADALSSVYTPWD